MHKVRCAIFDGNLVLIKRKFNLSAIFQFGRTKNHHYAYVVKALTFNETRVTSKLAGLLKLLFFPLDFRRSPIRHSVIGRSVIRLLIIRRTVIQHSVIHIRRLLIVSYEHAYSPNTIEST